MKPYYTDAQVTIYHGDCRKILPQLEGTFDVVLTDPPYGIGLATDYAKRFRPAIGKWWKVRSRESNIRHKPIIGDDEPFDPALLLGIPSRAKVFWGANCYLSKLPDRGGWWVWDKRNGKRDVSEADWPMGEGELAWTNIGKGVRIFRHTWFGLIRDSERGQHFHPTQKPVALMEWCLRMAKASGPVLDPYCGSGPTLLAARNMGLPVVGIETDEEHCATAVRRLSQKVLALERCMA